MKVDLSGKTALVTGASKGIGRAIAEALCGAGAAVVINFNSSAEKAEDVRRACEERGGKAVLSKADISKQEEVSAMFELVRKRFGGLDILVNNAGIIRDMPLLSMEPADWDKVHNVNLRGAYLCTRMALELMLPRHAGKIVNIASVNAIRGGRGQTNYAAAKGGLVAFTRACAVEWACKGIQVNAVLPGMVVTDMNARVRKRAGDEILSRIPAGRFGEASDVAALVVFLSSPFADYITGEAVAVDGGMSAN